MTVFEICAFIKDSIYYYAQALNKKSLSLLTPENEPHLTYYSLDQFPHKVMNVDSLDQLNHLHTKHNITLNISF